MRQSDIVSQLMFDYKFLNESEIRELCGNLDRKIVRWLGANHPDNRTRKIFFQQTNVEIGEDTVLNANLIISDGYLPLVKFGSRVAVAPNVIIIAQSAPNNSRLQELEYVKTNLIEEEPVIIEDDAWIGANVIILPGVTIGRMSIIGAGAVVTRDIPPFSIAAGIPAKVIRIMSK